MWIGKRTFWKLYREIPYQYKYLLSEKVVINVISAILRKTSEFDFEKVLEEALHNLDSLIWSWELEEAAFEESAYGKNNI